VRRKGFVAIDLFSCSEVRGRFCKKIRTENVFFEKEKDFTGAFEAKLSEVFVRNNFVPKCAPRNEPHSPFDPENREGAVL
jgi:hypothetical protein